MKKLLKIVATLSLVASPALADFKGFYAGLKGSTVSGTSTWTFSGYDGDFLEFTEGAEYPVEGTSYGGYAGFNIQSGTMVYGIEGEYNQSTDAIFGEVTNGLSYYSQIDTFSSIRARAGFASGNALIYATAGYAMADGFSAFDVPGGSDEYAESWSGWVYGAGVDFMIPDTSWMVRGEIAMYDFSADTRNYDTECCDIDNYDVDTAITMTEMTLGVAYTF